MNAIPSGGASGSPGVDTSYNPFLPYSETMSEKIRAQKGPRCANNDCGKPKWVSASEGGCTCPRHREDASPEAAKTFKAPELRRIEALEGIYRVLSAIAENMGVKLDDAAATPAPAPAAATRPAEPARKAS